MVCLFLLRARPSKSEEEAATSTQSRQTARLPVEEEAAQRQPIDARPKQAMPFDAAFEAAWAAVAGALKRVQGKSL